MFTQPANCFCLPLKRNEKSEETYMSTKFLLRNNSLFISTNKIMLTRITPYVRGYLTRKIITIKNLGGNFIHTKISGGKNSILNLDTPAGEISNLMSENAAYESILILKGYEKLDISTTSTQQSSIKVDELVTKYECDGDFAFINGGFFVHNSKMLGDGKYKISDTGKPIGQVKNRLDYFPIPTRWSKDYSPLYNGKGELLLYSAPVLTAKISFDSTRFKYFTSFTGKKAKRSNIIGSLSHANQPNERAAICHDSDNVKFCTVTATSRKYGITMNQWNDILIFSMRNRVLALNVDGGNSIKMGIKINGEIKVITKSGNSCSERAISNIIVCKPKKTC